MSSCSVFSAENRGHSLLALEPVGACAIKARTTYGDFVLSVTTSDGNPASMYLIFALIDDLKEGINP